MSFDDSLGDLLRKMRVSSGKTQVDLANDIGSHQPFISNFEKGRMKPGRDQILKIGHSIGLEADELNLLLAAADYDKYEPGNDKIEKIVSSSNKESKEEISKGFNTQLEDLKYIVSSLDSKLTEGKPGEDELKNQIEELQTTVEDLRKKGATLSAPVQLPSSQKMAVKLVPTSTFDTLEEYRSDQNKWFSVCTLFVGSILGIVINLSTGAKADKTTWIVLVVLLVISLFSGHSGWCYSQRSKKLKDSIGDMYSGENG
ncbi:helix-turn-helix domain-containing protein [Salinicola acroporae]|uniref:helix-turn-helix domain-containing protein n=1 Tax=Salinicola acroporae TaxID=1541440 RepID=UPI000DA17D43|nr:helix-turn-helix transcriptional regulator [Salinicola acroporae]